MGVSSGKSSFSQHFRESFFSALVPIFPPLTLFSVFKEVKMPNADSSQLDVVVIGGECRRRFRGVRTTFSLLNLQLASPDLRPRLHCGTTMSPSLSSLA